MIDIVSDKIVKIFRVIYKNGNNETRKHLVKLRKTWNGLICHTTLLLIDKAMEMVQLKAEIELDKQLDKQLESRLEKGSGLAAHSLPQNVGVNEQRKVGINEQKKKIQFEVEDVIFEYTDDEADGSVDTNTSTNFERSLVMNADGPLVLDKKASTVNRGDIDMPSNVLSAPLVEQKASVCFFVKSFLFDKIEKHEKNVEARVASTQFTRVKEGDIIKFISGRKSTMRRVMSTAKYNSFEELLKAEGINDCLPGVSNLTEAVSYYHSFPNYQAMERTYRVLAFRLEQKVAGSSALEHFNDKADACAKFFDGSQGVIRKVQNSHISNLNPDVGKADVDMSTFDPKTKIAIPVHITAASTLHRVSTNDDDKMSQDDGMSEADDISQYDELEDATTMQESTMKPKRTISWKQTKFVYEMSDELFSSVFDTETNMVKHEEWLYRKDSIAIEIDPIFTGCVISIDKYSACRKYWKLRAYCIHIGCRRYVLTATYSDPRRFTIQMDKLQVCHKGQVSRQLRRFERDKDSETLKNTLPRNLRAKKIKAADDEITIAGNYQGVQSVEVIQKVRSTSLESQDKCSDDIDDVEAMRTNDPKTNFISNTLSRKHFAVYIHSKRQHDILHKLHLLREKFGIQIVGRTDASGNIARDIEAGVLLYYALTSNIGIKDDKTTTPFPFTEQFNVNHTSIDIARWFFDFVLSHAYFFENHPLLFDWMVTDFSYANFHAILKAFNSISLKEYLNLAMKWVHDKQINGNFADIFFKMVKVRMCYTHLMHTFALMTKRLYGKNKNKQLPQSKIILEILGTMIKANDYQLLLKCWQQLATLLKNEYVNDHVNDAVLRINNIKESAIDLNEYDEEKLVKAVDVEKMPEYDATLYKSNLFYQQFSEISDKVVPYEYNEKTKEKNIYYNPEFLQKFLVRFVPLIPLWTSILSYESKSTTDEPPPLTVLQHFQPID